VLSWDEFLSKFLADHAESAEKMRFCAQSQHLVGARSRLTSRRRLDLRAHGDRPSFFAFFKLYCASEGGDLKLSSATTSHETLGKNCRADHTSPPVVQRNPPPHVFLTRCVADVRRTRPYRRAVPLGHESVPFALCLFAAPYAVAKYPSYKDCSPADAKSVGNFPIFFQFHKILC
jgi:hypothetical protein